MVPSSTRTDPTGTATSYTNLEMVRNWLVEHAENSQMSPRFI